MRLGLLDLIAPQFLIDFRLPEEIHNIVAFLRVGELDSAWDESGIVHVGKAVFDGAAAASPTPLQKRPTGELFEWGDINVEFRLTIPRDGSPDLKQVIDKAASIGGTSGPLGNLKATVDRLGTVPATNGASDYPGFAFRLELLLSTVTLHLPKSQFLPARLAADGRLEVDPERDDVQLKLPKIAVVVTRDNKPLSADADFEGWGVTGLDDDLDPAAGEMIAMAPPLALHESKVFGFGLEKAVLDLSADKTPPEILALTGTGDDFKGLWLPRVRIFVAPKSAEGLAFDLRAQDLLIDFKEGVSGEFGLEVLNKVDGKIQVESRFYEGDRMILTSGGHTLPGDPRATTVRGSRASVAADGELQLAIRGGQPQYTITVTRLDDNHLIPATPVTLPDQPANGAVNRVRWLLDGTPEGTAHFKVHVFDSSPAGKVSVWDEEIEVAVRPAGNRIGTTTVLPIPTLAEGAGSDGYRLLLSDSQPDPGAVILQASPAPLQAVAVTGAAVTPSAAGEIRVPVTAGGPQVTVSATWPTSSPPPFTVRFASDAPEDGQVDAEVQRIVSVSGGELEDFARRASGRPVNIVGRAAYAGDPASAEYRKALSEQRAEVLKQAILQAQTDNGVPASTITTQGGGFVDAKAAFEFALASYVPEDYEVAVATFSPVATAPARAVTVARGQATEIPLVIPTERGPAPLEPERPPFFRKIGTRVRLERNKLVLFEIGGEVDFKTAAEERAGFLKDTTGGDHPQVANQTGSGLTVTTQPGATADAQANPGDGIVDYRLTVSYDTASRKLSEQIAFGAGDADRDGLVHINNSTPAGAIGNVAGALAIFAPLLSSSINSAVTPGTSPAVPLALGAAELGLAATLGLTDAVKMQRMLWYGAEINAQQTTGNTTSFDEAALLLDYGVDFFVSIKAGPLNIQSKTDTPLRVRYKALGFKMDFGKGKAFSPVFDTSKGYQLDLADPGLFNVSAPFGDILKILGARVARTNPLVVELDLGMKVNLGVITVDSIRLTWPLDPAGPPTILPTGLSVNIPGVLTGSGFVDMRNGIKGSLDLTLVPVKLRIAGAIVIQPMAPPLTPPGRKVTAVYVGLSIEFPTAIPIGASGIGLYGILGLFGMHFKRNENKAAEVPALDWLTSVNGDPTATSGNPQALTGWVPDVDRWAFGVGAVLGTLGSGTILNLKGMLVLELPGPRILLFVKMQILAKQPATRGDVKQIGILAVVDLDFELNRLTIGLALNYDVPKLLSLKLPVKALFNFEDPKDWELDIGTVKTPVSAMVLNIVKASGYLMFAGKQIADFPSPPGPDGGLPGFAIALGVRASIVFGDQSIGLFLKVSAGLDAALVFSPFHVYGLMELRGQLHLFIISLSAWATLDVDAPEPTIVDGHACASIDLFFFELSGCVDIHIGPDTGAVLEPPPLVDSMALQSHSPALVQSQGTDRPIDGKLGDAIEVSEISSDKSDPKLKDLKRVPIDSIPILKMHAAPNEKGSTTFTESLGVPPRQALDGWMDQGGGRSVRYNLKSLQISPPPPASPFGPIPATWRAESSTAQGQDTAVDLAMFSWEPVSDARAYQRSAELTQRIENRWGGICAPPAPPAGVLWTFRDQPVGPAGGWTLKGTAFPDPPGTFRSTPIDTRLVVHGPPYDPVLAAMQGYAGNGVLEPARIIGFDSRPGAVLKNSIPNVPGRALQLPFLHPRDPAPQPPPPPAILGSTVIAAGPAVATRTDSSTALAPSLVQTLQTIADPLPKRVIVESGPCQSARLLVGHPFNMPPTQLLIRAFSANNALIGTATEATLPTVPVASFFDLPAPWANTQNLPKLEEIIQLFQQKHPGADLRLITYLPPVGTVRFEVVANIPNGGVLPSAFLAAIELVRGTEVARAQHDAEVKASEISTVEGALTASNLRPLLAPDTRYTISLDYESEVRLEDKKNPGTFLPSTKFARRQRYSFITDAAAPERLNPWVLATTPSEGEPAHFTADPLRVVFNDKSAVQLYAQYGKSLRAVIRNANGNHPPNKPNLTLEAISSPTKNGRLLQTPFEQGLRDMLINGEVTGCISLPDAVQHGIFNVPVELERGTAYTLDIEPTDLPAYPTNPQAPARAPLFRTAFTTSRFNSAVEFAAVMRKAKVSHRALKGSIGTLSSTPSDNQLEAALRQSGLEALPSTGQPSITLLWQPQGNDFVLAAALVDAPEALWRFRPEPVLLTENSDNGFMKHFVNLDRPYLEVVQTGGSTAVAQFIRSSGGTRGLFLLNPGATSLKLGIRQHELALIDETKFTDSEFFSATLPTVAPWRSDNA